MRELKFRAWFPREKTMYQVSPTPNGCGYYDNVSKDVHEYLEGVCSKPMQYTGLKDNKEVEIYEGDIVKIYYCELEDEPESHTVGKVAWYDCYYPAFDIYIKSETHRTGFETFSDEWNAFSCPDYVIEVIGNIYENPELLEA